MTKPVSYFPDIAVAGKSIEATLPALIKAAAEAYAEREYLVYQDQRLTFKDVEEKSAQLALGLLSLGLGKGSRVGLLMPNNPDWVLSWFASARVGAFTTALSTFFSAPELSWALRHNDIDTLLIADRYLSNDYLDRLERAIPELAQQTSAPFFLPSHPYLRRILVWGKCDRPWALKGPDELLSRAASDPRLTPELLSALEANISPTDSLISICTSGSTAEPKVVVHSHGTTVRAPFLYLPNYDFRKDDRHYSGYPFFWIGGINVNLIPNLYVGGCQVCTATPKADDIAAAIARERITRLAIWPAQAAAIREASAMSGYDLSSVRIGLGEPRDESGAVIPKDKRFGGVFGMTESFGMHSVEAINKPAQPGKAGSHGRPLLGLDRRIVDRDTGEILPIGGKGELQVRGPQLMQGYYKRERSDVFTPDGFFPTGDICLIDKDDHLYFFGRASEMIKTTGANVSPREVEVALLRCEGVQEAYVFGVADRLKGELVAAIAVPAEGRSLDPEMLLDRLREELSSYKVPKILRVIPAGDIPRTHNEKVSKPRLRANLESEFRAQPGR